MRKSRCKYFTEDIAFNYYLFLAIYYSLDEKDKEIS